MCAMHVPVVANVIECHHERERERVLVCVCVLCVSVVCVISISVVAKVTECHSRTFSHLIHEHSQTSFTNILSPHSRTFSHLIHSYRVAKTHRMPYLIDHFPQISH